MSDILNEVKTDVTKEVAAVNQEVVATESKLKTYLVKYTPYLIAGGVGFAIGYLVR